MARILFVTQTAHPWGGVEVWLEYLAAGLARQHEVTIGLVRGRYFHDPTRYRPSVASIEIPALTGTLEGRVRAVSHAIDAVGADVVVPVNIVDVLEAVRRLKSHGRAVRLFYPLHALTAGYFLDVRAFRSIIDMAGTTNRLTERGLIEISALSPERVCYAFYGVPPPHSAPRFDRPSSFRLVYAGRLTQEQKRIRDLVPLCEELERRGVTFSLDIAGAGDDEEFLRSALVRQPHVRFLGLRTTEELYADVYPGAAALLLLSEWETGPLVAWEAMRHAATVVTTAYLGLRAEGRLIHGGNSLIAPIGDIGSLADAIERLSEDPALLARLRRAAYDTVESECTFERSVAAWGAAVDACLSVDPACDTREVTIPRSRGRLDRWFGDDLAESIRGMAGIGMRHSDPGGEWPHTYHHLSPESAAIDAKLKDLDT